MDRSPCLDCDRREKDKRHPRCVACTRRKDYADSMGATYYTLPLEMTDMGNKMKRWSDEDRRYLINNYLTKKNKELALDLNCTPIAVAGQLSNLKLRRNARRSSKTGIVPAESKESKSAGTKKTISGYRSSGESSGKRKNKPNPDGGKRFGNFMLDFRSHGDLHDRFCAFCAGQFRDPNQQVLYMITQAVEDYEHRQSTK